MRAQDGGQQKFVLAYSGVQWDWVILLSIRVRLKFQVYLHCLVLVLIPALPVFQLVIHPYRKFEGISS
jgi:hypothetical protein